MTRFHWLVLAMGMMGASSLALVGCGGDDEVFACDTNEDCAEGELCAQGVCAEPCFTADDCSNTNQGCSGACEGLDEPICFFECQANEDCGDGQICNLAFCGDAPFGRCEPIQEGECSSNEDCAEGEFCNVFAGVCEALCESDEDCDEGFLCNSDAGICVASGASCIDDEGCGDGEICVDEICVPEDDSSCEDAADCYDRGDSYCAEVGGENQCVSTACGAAGNTCGRCTLGANNGAMQENGPVIFFAEQLPVTSGANCEVGSANCGGEEASLYCEFSFHYFDPDGDFSPSNSNLFVVSGRGTTSTTFNVRDIGTNIGAFGACFPTGANNPGTAIFVRDAADNASNTLCTNGTRF